MEIMKELDKFADVFGLGRLIESPKEVQGGLLHKMYRVTTLQGTYAVKVLNSAMGLEAADVEEIQSGEQQVKRTLDDLYAYQAKAGMLKEWLQ